MSEYPIVATEDGITRQVIADHPDLMIVAFRFDRAGLGGDVHHHPHVKVSYVQSGRFRYRLGDSECEMGPGDSLVIPSRLQHGCVCVEPGAIIDSFTPRRDDFL
ncbi:cupin domain-containing protein [Maliponia aquimaris]|uniref:Cupin domain protein n=1 Tax=Maliponia aquimaris TaxID=1673631 RepID=A0A238K847_9RHOB|nr:cupin domain-containing protein [Maliponia aquimaris]SMX39068.1 Cupin domain protein [Maliponia aquimaris]